MANRRMLSKKVSLSKKINRLTLKSQLVWTWMLPYLDDFGCYTADPEDIKHEVFPKNKINIKDIEKSLGELSSAGLVRMYLADGKFYIQYSKFDDFQTFRQDRMKRSEYPKYEDGKPVATIDTHKLSEVKLSKDKLSKEQELADAVLKIVFDDGFNIYKCLFGLKKKLGVPKDYNIPAEVILKVCKQYFKDKEKITKPWPWFIKVMAAESEQHYAKENIKANDEEKEIKGVSSDKDINAIIQGLARKVDAK